MNEFLGEIISGFILQLTEKRIGKERQSPAIAIDRKNKVYQPLLEELEPYTESDWSILDDVNAEYLHTLVEESYKCPLPEKLQEECSDLDANICNYNQIDVVRVAHNIIIEIFKDAYEALYGSIYDGIFQYREYDGSVREDKKLATPIQLIEEGGFEELIDDLLYNEGMYSDVVLINREQQISEPIYGQLKEIYHQALNVWINEEKYSLPEAKIEIDMLPEEYIAYHYDFFERYNAHAEIKEKKKNREEIIYKSQGIVQELKEIIETIVRKYEMEKM